MKLSNYKRMLVFTLLLATVATTGCSSTEKKIDQKIATEPTLKNSEELGAEARFLVETNPSFSSEQKQKLLNIQKETRTKLSELEKQSLKIRELLIREMTADVYHQEEVDVIKKKLKDNEDQKIKTYFRAITDANEVLGRKKEWQSRRQFMRDVINLRGPD